MLLKDAKKTYLGTQALNAIYLGTTQVWKTAWTPATISGLKIWFDASQLPQAVGANVSPWPNLADAAKPGAMVTNPGNDILPIVSTRSLNGKKIVRFYNNQARLRMTGTGISYSYTLAYLARLVNGGIAGRVVTASYPPPNFLIGFWNGYQDVAYDNGFFSPDTRTAVIWDQWKLYSADGDITAYQPRMFSSGVLLGTGSTGGGWNGTLNISGYDATGIQETCDIEMAELVLYDRKLSDSDRQTVENYMKTKWGLP